MNHVTTLFNSNEFGELRTIIIENEVYFVAKSVATALGYKDTAYMDNRIEDTTLCDGRRLIVKPDIMADFREIPYKDETFYLVIFDPPHLLRAGEESYLKLKYGRLGENWKEDIKKGLEECWRVLKRNGTMIFKWNEEQIALPQVKKLLPCEPIIGQRRGKTIWLVFFKQ